VGEDPLDPQQRQFIYEKNLVAFPTMPLVLCAPAPWYKEAGIDQSKVVHGEQSLEIIATLPTTGVVRSQARVVGTVDRGPQKGLVIYTERTLVSDGDGRILARLRSTSIARGDGGKWETTMAAPVPRPVPDHPADGSIVLSTRPSIAALYRLNSDLNPLHIDPDFARRAGFDRPILHGLATMGVAAHAIVRGLCDYRPDRLKAIGQRFSAPMFPGETLRVEYWRDGDRLAFRGFAEERGVKVLDSGHAVIST
jgi:acyl dehydratase